MRILLASGNPAVAQRWHGLLAHRHRLELCPSVEALKSLAARDAFDLILLHRPLVDQPGFAALRRAAPAARFFLLSDQPDEEEGLAFLKLGILGYGNTYMSPERLAAAIGVVETGGVWLGQKVIHQLIRDSHAAATERSLPAAGQQLSLLTPMERKVAELIARGLTNLAIAAELDITERTVKAHLTAIYDKLRVGNRLSLALLVNQSRI